MLKASVFARSSVATSRVLRTPYSVNFTASVKAKPETQSPERKILTPPKRWAPNPKP